VLLLCNTQQIIKPAIASDEVFEHLLQEQWAAFTALACFLANILSCIMQRLIGRTLGSKQRPSLCQ